MRRTLSPLAPGLSALTLLLLVGCTAPQVTHRLLDTPTSNGKLTLFGQADGKGALSIRIVDQRPRKTQSFSDADVFNAVLFRLSNTTKLKTAMQFATGSAVATPSNTYSAAFPSIPADTAGNYTLSVGLFRNIASPSNPANPAYGDLLNKVGEGASTSIALAPGENKTVTVFINAVGQFFIDSQTVFVNQAGPILVSGDTAIVDTKVNFANNPDTQKVNVFLTDMSDLLVPGASLSVNNLASPSTVAPLLTLPYVATSSAYKLVVQTSGTPSAGVETVWSRRTRLVTIEGTASLAPLTLQ